MSLAKRVDPQSDARSRFLSVAAQLKGLSRVEEVILSKLTSDAPMLEEIPRYLLSLGGKRIRPMLTLLVHELFSSGDPSSDVVDVAAGIELIHMATLLHDDIIDRSALRRHKTSPFFAYGLPGTLLSGDFLLVRAFALCAHLDTYIIEATEQACVELTEGEILETSLQTTPHTIDSSIQIAQKKTASLFRLSCETGSFLAGRAQDTVKKMAAYGENLGIAFQIVDDILDVKSSEEKLGKKPGTDIRERKPALVNILWLAGGSAQAKRLLIDQRDDEVSDSEIEVALAEIQQSDVLERAQEHARRYVQRAQEAFDDALSGEQQCNADVADALRALSEYALERME